MMLRFVGFIVHVATGTAGGLGAGLVQATAPIATVLATVLTVRSAEQFVSRRFGLLSVGQKSIEINSTIFAFR